MKYDPTETRRRLKWVNENWKSWERRELVLPDGFEITPYVGFSHSNMEGTYTKHGVVLDVFNGYRKKEISSPKWRKTTINYASGAIFRNVPPASTEPHARILFEDSACGEDFFSEVWVPIRELTFLSEAEMEECDSWMRTTCRLGENRRQEHEPEDQPLGLQ